MDSINRLRPDNPATGGSASLGTDLTSGAAEHSQSPALATTSAHHGQDVDSEGQELGTENAEEYGPDGADAKRSRACEACRGLKVRCEPDPEADGEEGAPCKRCRKAGRRCIVTAPSRKRQRKTDNRVSDLERKIDALTASLQARGAAAGIPSARTASPAEAGGRGESISGSSVSPPRPRSTDRAHELADRTQSGTGFMRPPERTSTLPWDHKSTYQSPAPMAGRKRSAPEQSVPKGSNAEPAASPYPSTVSPWTRPDQGDIIDRGLLSMDTANDLFTRYTERMAPHMPAVIFRPGMTASELRRAKPTLFVAVMATASSEMHALQLSLQKEMMISFAEKTFLTGEKNLEIVQAMLLSAIWYYPPDHFEDLKFYQIVHNAAVMAIDIGLGKKPAGRGTGQPFVHRQWPSHPTRRQVPPDPTDIESRRTWLACYFLTCNTAIALHRPHLVRWTPFMTECIEVLQTSPLAAPTDKYFTHLVQQHRLGEEVGAQFSLDDTANPADINDSRTQYAMKALERELEKYRSAASAADTMKASLAIGYDIISLYMHEIVLHTRSFHDQLRPPFSADELRDNVIKSESLSPSHVSAISSCITAVKGIFATFLSVDVDELRCVPVYNFVRVSYAVVTLIKMYFSASTPDSELGQVISKDDLQVARYLDALIEKFQHSAMENRSRPAAKFLVVLSMLKSWFLKQEAKDSGGDTGKPGQPPSRSNTLDTSSSETPRDTTTSPPYAHSEQQSRRESLPPQYPQQPATPLHLLSEVATGSDTNPRSASNNMFGLSNGLRQPPQPFFADTPSSSTSSDPHNQPQAQQQLPAFSNPPGSWQPPTSFPMDINYPSQILGDANFMNLGADLGAVDEYGRPIFSEPWLNEMFQGMQGMQDPGLMFPF